MVFSGMSTNIPDEASYLMWSRQHAQGHFLVSNHMTTEPHSRILPNPAWLTVGLVARVTGEPVIVSYHVVRALFAFIYLMLLWELLLRIMPERNAARVAWTIIAVGGGLGWLKLAGLAIPSADWITELWSWPSMLHYPHFALALALVTGFFLLWLDILKKGGRIRALAGGLVLTLLALVHPYTAITVVAALVLHFLFNMWRLARASRGKELPQGLLTKASPGLPWVLLGAVPGFAALVVQTLLNPMVAKWASQNVMTSPPPWEYMFGFGFVGIAAAACFVRFVRGQSKPSEIHVLFVAWTLIAMILAYADPIVPFARRCVEGIHLAIVVLAVTWAFDLPRRARIGCLAVLLVTTLPSPLMHIYQEVRADNPGYVVGDHDRMIDAVRTYVRDGNVLADPRSSLFIAADTDAAVFVGHHEVTADFVDKAKQVHRFLESPSTWAERRDMLDRTDCQWFLASPQVMDRQLQDPAPGRDRASGLREYARGNTWVLVGPDGGLRNAPNAGQP